MKKWSVLLFATTCLSLTVRSAGFYPIGRIRSAAIAERSAAPAPVNRLAHVNVNSTMPADSIPSGFTGRLMTGKMHYTAANTHSHNDYEQPVPFWMAWQEQFGSIEADIWLVNGQVLVGHSREEIKNERTLEEYYVKPLLTCIRENNGHPYADTTRLLQILIDVKMDSVNTLNALIALLDRYPELEHTPQLTWVISGNRPAPDTYTSYPPFILFDGVLRRQYTAAEYSKISMLSDDLQYYTRWDGTAVLPAPTRKTIQEAVDRAHSLHLPVRFWDAPDTPEAWRQLMDLHVDYLNTDHIRELATWLKDQ